MKEFLVRVFFVCCSAFAIYQIVTFMPFLLDYANVRDLDNNTKHKYFVASQCVGGTMASLTLLSLVFAAFRFHRMWRAPLILLALVAMIGRGLILGLDYRIISVESFEYYMNIIVMGFVALTWAGVMPWPVKPPTPTTTPPLPISPEKV